MKITDNTVVQFHYTLTNQAGEQVESSRDGDPVAYLHGHKNMIVGVEKALADKEQGDSFSVTVTPEEGYGERQEDAVQRVPTKHLQGAKVWKPGMIATVHTEQGQRQVSVVKVGKFMVTVDINHPLAGQTLTFDIDVVNVREATEEEVSHGHAHGVGGHQH
ncbi:peptidylprolyl isomerase [Endozoicomonas sp. G2_1]|uniref:FKBP-type peptidyl-prolyl cis-trans isomerase n=1 Tax=Endozoicomonas sp. G2_1 TaxID=2821091 RepID=UPI001ADC5B08|nr:peptidylprolyl isomerase [Endozoicomonas sp. G2_1]MBO9491792.1 peptidylprolyl isomerase [Endozoicomonas sp. G2_1]